MKKPFCAKLREETISDIKTNANHLTEKYGIKVSQASYIERLVANDSKGGTR